MYLSRGEYAGALVWLAYLSARGTEVAGLHLAGKKLLREQLDRVADSGEDLA